MTSAHTDDDEFVLVYALELSKCSYGGGGTHKRSCPLNLHRQEMVSPDTSDANVDTQYNDDVTISHVEPNLKASVFGSPKPTEEWKARAATFMTNLSKKAVSLRSQHINKLDSRDIRDKIQGDGNCLFRAISKAVKQTT